MTVTVPGKPRRRSARAVACPARLAPTTVTEAMPWPASAPCRPQWARRPGRCRRSRGDAGRQVRLLVGQRDVDVAVHHRDRMRPDTELGRRRVDLTGAQVEPRGVQRALDLAALEPAV